MDKSIINRFWSKVDRSGNCWEWAAAKTKGGYGQFHINNKMQLAHRVSWVIHNSDIPSGDHYGTTCVLHRCDNPSCVNPDHLFLGTQKDNNQDRMNKGRNVNVVGEQHGKAKLSSRNVREIRRHSPAMTYREIAETFCISSSQVCNIVNRRVWKHI